jgi:putative ABC transport system permease protein
MGTALASAFAAVVLDRLLEIHYHPDALTSALAIAISSATATAAGWLASFRILGRKPLEILREE